MGILSEIDMMNRDTEDDAFEISSDSETVDSFSEEFEPIGPQKPAPQEEAEDEARKKAEFNAAEAKRKAEWEAKQAQKKLREQQELDRLAAMSDDDVMQASMNRVSQDTERLTRRNMKLCVMEDVQTECLADPDFARLVMNEAHTPLVSDEVYDILFSDLQTLESWLGLRMKNSPTKKGNHLI